VELHRTVGRLAAAVRTLATSALVAGGAKLDAVLHAEALGRSVLDVPSTTLPPPPARTAPGQDPVAVRATPEVLAALELTLAHLADALDAALGAPSDNPIVGEEAFLEQASFLAPGVAIATSGVIEVLLLTATWTERMIHWLCSGEAGALPEDLRVGAGLGLIQVPKLATAWVEGMRMAHGRRTLASGSSTSHEIEDLWTNGLHATVDADAAAVRLCRLLALLATAVDVAHDLGAPVIETSWDRARGDLDERTHLHLDQIDRHLDRDRTLVVPDGG
jgi:histidine ammonia-lyase